MSSSNTPNETAKPPVTSSVKSIPQEDTKVKLTWNDYTEEMLAEWGDVASCYKWLHEQAYRKKYNQNWWMSLVAIVLSTITGTVNVGLQALVPAAYVSIAGQGVGGINLFIAIINTLQSKLRVAELSEAHQAASVGWNKLERNIRIELQIERKNRKDAEIFIRNCRSEYDRLLEQSPVIPKEMIKKFNSKFAHLHELKKPDICDALNHTSVTKPVIEQIEESIQEEPVLKHDQEDVLNQIKDMLAESRLVPIGMKDHELPGRTGIGSFGINYQTTNQNHHAWRKTSDISLMPRKSFMGEAPQPIKIETSSVNVKELLKKFEKNPPYLVNPNINPLVKRRSNSDISNLLHKVDESTNADSEEEKVEVQVVSDNQEREEQNNSSSTSVNASVNASINEASSEAEEKKVPLMDLNDLL